MRTADLVGEDLNYWVARADGKTPIRHSGHWFVGLAREEAYRPSADWSIAGPIIESEHFYLEWGADGYWVASHPESITYRHERPLVAVMRAFVASRFGSEVDEVKA